MGKVHHTGTRKGMMGDQPRKLHWDLSREATDTETKAEEGRVRRRAGHGDEPHAGAGERLGEVEPFLTTLRSFMLKVLLHSAALGSTPQTDMLTCLFLLISSSGSIFLIFRSGKILTFFQC